MGKLKTIIIGISLLLLFYSCKDDENLTSPDLDSKLKAEIILPYYVEDKVYPERDRFPFYCILNLAGEDSVEVDSVIWKSDIDGDVRNKHYFIKAGTHNITCSIYKDELVFDTTIVVKISDELKLNTKDLGQGWTEYSFFEELVPGKPNQSEARFWEIDFDDENNFYISWDSNGLIYKDGDQWRYYSIADGLTESIFKFIINHNIIFCGDGSYSSLYILGADEKWRFYDYTKTIGSWSEDIHSLTFDDNNKLWLGTHSGLILTYNDRVFEKIEVPKTFFRLDELIFKNKKLYGVGSWTELFEFDGNNWKLYEFPNLRYSSTCLEVEADTIWTGGSRVLYKIINGNITSHSDPENYITDNRIFQILKDSKGNLWLATYNGVIRYQNGNWKMFEREIFTQQEELFPEDLKEDKEGNIWVIYENKVAKYSNNN